MYYVYILRLHNGDYYAGFTANLKNRLIAHRQNDVQTTKNAKAKELVFYVAFQSSEKARAFEKYLKSSSGFAFRNKHLV